MSEDELQSASGSDTRTGDAGMFCVIGASVNSTFGRTWKRNQADAATHARKIIRYQADNGDKKKHVKLFVVQVVEVLETPQVAIISRGTTEEDFETIDDEVAIARARARVEARRAGY